MPIQLILTQAVDNLGKAGDLVTVKPGYGRNYLIPQRLAVTATMNNRKRLEHERRTIDARVSKEMAVADALASKISGMTLQFERRVGAEEKLFGSVTAKDLADQLQRAGITIDHRKIQLDEPVKALGKYEVGVKIHPNVAPLLKFWVVGKDE